MKKNIVLIILLVASFTVNGQNFDSTVEKLIEENIDEIIELRHWFHQNAELSNREFKTAERIKNELIKIGYKPNIGIAKTGVVAILNEGKQGPVVGLRADIDGLPIKERVDIPWASKMTGVYNGEEVPVMHACGHDMHTAILLATAKILYELKDQIPGQVKFIFQPAEEGAPVGEEGGAELMVKEGVLKNPDVDAIFGLHIAAQLPMNKVYYKPRGFYASSSRFTIKVIGTQAHGGTPWLAVDPIIITAQIINSIQTIISRESELTKEPAVISFGKVEGGNRFNIIPNEVNLVGTIRSLDYGMRDYIKKRIIELSEGIAESYGGKAIVEIDDGADITYNDPEIMDRMLPSLKKSAGNENVILSNAKTLAEDYAYYLNEIPGFLFELGGYNTNEEREAPAHHTPDFFIDDSSMLLGVKVMTNLALDFLKSE